MATTLSTTKIRHINPHATNGITLADHINDMANRVNQLKEEIAEVWLLADIEQTKSVYSMSYEEYMELPGNVRL